MNFEKELSRFIQKSETPFEAWILWVWIWFLWPLAAGASGAEVDSTRHLLDFSSDRATVFVDPLLDLAWGPSFPGPHRVWRNIRGATFKARWDDQWSAWGSLEEHQSIRVGQDAWWCQNSGSLPGWGRAKTGRSDGDWNTLDSLYVDVARAEGGLHWEAQSMGRLAGWTLDLVVNRWHWGVKGTQHGVLGSPSTQAPAPRIRVAHQNTPGDETPSALTWFETTKWVLDQRGPLGATSESLFEWTQSWIVGHERRSETHRHWGVVAGHTRLAGRDRLQPVWTDPASAWWGGLSASSRIQSFWFGAEGIWESTRQWDGKADDPTTCRLLGVAGVDWPNGHLRVEHARQPGDVELRATAPNERSLLTHAGLPLGLIWTRATSLYLSQDWPEIRSNVSLSAERNDYSDVIFGQCQIQLWEQWPLHINITSTFWLKPQIRVYQVGVVWWSNRC